MRLAPATAPAFAPIFRKVLLSGALLGIAAGLAACDPNRSASSVKTPIVSSQALTRDIAFLADGSIAPQDAASLQAFLTSMSLGSGDRLMLDDPHAEGAAARRAAVGGIVAASGGQLTNSPPPAATAMPQGTARLWIVRTQVTLPACPDWSSSPYGNMNASTHSNYGCASNSNLAVMVANPNDLVDGQRYEGPSAADIAKSHDHWQRRVPTGYEKELTKASTTDDK